MLTRVAMGPALLCHVNRWRIYHDAYAKGRAFITADDIAGGDFQDKHTQLHTLVAPCQNGFPTV